ncbi:hypothetical protein KRM28CT15_15000 [Krasilnikovia sp. M28-CT-15]
MDGEGFSTRGGTWIFDRRLRTPWSPSSARPYARATWPSAKLRATKDELSISSVLFEPFVVTRGNLTSITAYDWLPALGRGLRFEVSDRDEATVFWTYRRGMIMRQLVSLGWRIDETP